MSEWRVRSTSRAASGPITTCSGSWSGCALVGIILIGGPLVIAGLRLGVADDVDQLVDLLPILLKAIVVGGTATLAYAAVPLGFSALMPNRRHALALWATYYLVFGAMVYELGKVSSGSIAALDLPRAVQTINYALFDLKFRSRDAQIPVAAAVASLAAHAGLAIVLVFYQVRRAQRAGVGGAS
ncbi:MAG: hypothetical protein WKG01_39070 [Kofleriaceae bacterium]